MTVFFLPSVSAEQKSSQSGQVGILIILIMIVMLTAGLMVASRASEELALQKQSEDSTRVFNAAETGIERALSTNLNFAGESLTDQTFTSSDVFGNAANVTYSITKQRSLASRVAEGATAHVLLSDAGDDVTPGTLDIYWSKETNCAIQKPASLVISIYSADTSVSPTKYSVRHLATAACDHGDDIAVQSTNAEAGSGFFKKLTLALQAKDVFLRVKPVYNDTQLLVTNPSVGKLPVQAYQIRSQAKNQAGNEARAVEVYQTISAPPSVMDYAVMSGTTISKL